MSIKMNGYNKEKETIKDKVERIAREAGWSVYIEDETEDHICFDFGKYSPAGQDFHVSAELEDMEINTLMDNLNSRYADFDCSEETYLWLDSTGHGKNGAPYEMIDVYKDMEWCENKIYELFEIIQHEEIRQRNLYYRYIQDWCDSRNVSVEDVDEETGINGGECYACFSEFCDNEYLDEDYMWELEKNLD